MGSNKLNTVFIRYLCEFLQKNTLSGPIKSQKKKRYCLGSANKSYTEQSSRYNEIVNEINTELKPHLE